MVENSERRSNSWNIVCMGPYVKLACGLNWSHSRSTIPVHIFSHCLRNEKTIVLVSSDSAMPAWGGETSKIVFFFCFFFEEMLYISQIQHEYVEHHEHVLTNSSHKSVCEYFLWTLRYSKITLQDKHNILYNKRMSLTVRWVWYLIYLFLCSLKPFPLMFTSPCIWNVQWSEARKSVFKSFLSDWTLFLRTSLVVLAVMFYMCSRLFVQVRNK